MLEAGEALCQEILFQGDIPFYRHSIFVFLEERDLFDKFMCSREC
jgi:hypothetical protein